MVHGCVGSYKTTQRMTTYFEVPYAPLPQKGTVLFSEHMVGLYGRFPEHMVTPVL